MTTLRLAVAMPNKTRMALALSPSIRLAVCGPPVALEHGLGKPSHLPALLVSTVYLKIFLAMQSRIRFRDWVLDSGAFSVFSSGKTINHQQYISQAKHLLAADAQLTEVFSLDVIGDWKASRANVEEEWRQGLHTVPAFHFGEPLEYLRHLAATYPKIALGGCARASAAQKKRFIGRAFSAVWPKKIHGFGIASRDLLMSFPFHSVDATNWEMGPCAFGSWQAYGGAKLGIRGGKQPLRVEVEHYLRLEREVQQRWAREMQMLEVAA